MNKFAESDESTDSDENADSTIIAHSRVEPLNWYIANREWSMGHVSREANQSPRVHRYRDQDDDELSDSKSQEFAERLRKKCHFRNKEKSHLKKKCCACCCRNTSGTSLENKSETNKRSRTKKSIGDKTSSNEEKKQVKEKKKIVYDKKTTKARERNKKKGSEKKSMSGKKHMGATENELLSQMVTAGASADITKSCCYLCAQNSMAIVAARVSRPTEQLTRATQVTEMRQPHVRTVQSSVRVRTCDRSTDCPRPNGFKRKKFKFKNIKTFSKYMKNVWPVEKTVACTSNNTPVEKKKKKTCGKDECRRYNSPDL